MASFCCLDPIGSHSVLCQFLSFWFFFTSSLLIFSGDGILQLMLGFDLFVGYNPPMQGHIMVCNPPVSLAERRVWRHPFPSLGLAYIV